jgi:tetratricopeptide (TPR) repeat protein
VVAFETSAAFAVLCWLVFYYLQTGELWLVGASLGGGSLFRVAIGATLLLLPVPLWLGRRELQRVAVRLLALPQWFGYVSFATWTVALILILVPRGQPIDSWADLPSRFTNIPLFFRDVVFSSQPLLVLAIAGWPLALLSALRRKPRFQLLLLAGCLYFPVIFLISTPSAGRSWTSRHLMTLFLLSFICAGAVAAQVTTGLLHAVVRRRYARGFGILGRVVGPCIVLIFGALTLAHSARISRDYIQSEPLDGLVWFSHTVQETASWLENHVPAGSSILFLNRWYSYSIHFLTGARYDAMLSASGASTLMEKGTDGWHLVRRVDRSQEIESPLYVQEYSESPPYLQAYDRAYLMDEIVADGIDYLMVVTGPGRTSPRSEMQYFRDSPLSERVFHRDVQDYGIDIYRIQSQEYDSAAVDYPTEVEADSLRRWLERMAEDNLPYDEYTFLDIVGRQGVLIDSLQGEESQAASLYLRMGDLFAQHGDYEMAAFEYRMALEAVPALAQLVLEKALDMGARGGSEAGTLTVMGQAYESLGQNDLALDAYLRATETDARYAETWAAAYRGLGRIQMSGGNNEQALDAFEKSLTLSTVRAHTTRRQADLVRGNLYQQHGDIDQALLAYRHAWYADQGDQVEAAPLNGFTPSVDLVEQFVSGESVSANGIENHAAVFFVDNSPHRVLFAHPPATISYYLQIPAQASLRVAPVLSPEVWQVGKGDGVQFDITVHTAQHTRNVFSRYLDPKNVPAHRGWDPYEVDIGEWAGQTITLTLTTGAGPNSNMLYDWAAWGEPQITQPIAYDFLQQISQARIVASDPVNVQIVTKTIDYDPRPALFQRTAGQVTYSLTLPLQSSLRFGLGVDPAVWSSRQGNGVDSCVYVRPLEQPHAVHQVFHRYLDPKNNPDERHWFDEVIDLGSFGGQAVEITFESLPGPNGDAQLAWIAWSSPVLVDETLPTEEIPPVLLPTVSP